MNALMPRLLLADFTGCAQMLALEIPQFARTVVDSLRAPLFSKSAGGESSARATSRIRRPLITQ